MELRAAGYQMAVGMDIRQNADKICAAIQRAARAGAEILLTPEGSLSGYTPRFDEAELARELERVTAQARAERLGLALGTCMREADGRVYNQIRFYTPGGAFLGFHSKTLRCGTMSAPVVGEINDYAATELRVFDWDGLTIGGLICNDLWANPQCTPMPDPHLSQQLAGMGARVIFHAVNGGRDGSEWSREVAWDFHSANLRMRAAAGGVWIVTVDNSAPVDLPCSAPGGVLDPRGNWACRAEPQGEQLFVYPIPLA
jgi:predicted amidohydrolase